MHTHTHRERERESRNQTLKESWSSQVSPILKIEKHKEERERLMKRKVWNNKEFQFCSTIAIPSCVLNIFSVRSENASFCLFPVWSCGCAFVSLPFFLTTFWFSFSFLLSLVFFLSTYSISVFRFFVILLIGFESCQRFHSPQSLSVFLFLCLPTSIPFSALSRVVITLVKQALVLEAKLIVIMSPNGPSADNVKVRSRVKSAVCMIFTPVSGFFVLVLFVFICQWNCVVHLRFLLMHLLLSAQDRSKVYTRLPVFSHAHNNLLEEEH